MINARARISSVFALALCAGCAHGAADASAGPIEVERGSFLSCNDHEFTYEKRVYEGFAETTWFREGVAYTFEQVLAFDAANPRPKMDPAELALIQSLKPDQPVRLSVNLLTNPWPEVYRAVRDAHEPLLASRTAEVRELQRPMFPDRPLRESEEHEWAEQMPRFRALLAPGAQERIDRIKAEVDRLGVSIRDEVRAVVEPIVKAEQDAVSALVERLGGKVEGRLLLVSGLEIVLPAGRSADLLADDRVTRVFIANDGEPELSVTLPSLGVTPWHSAGFEGGVWDAAALDTGIQANHPAFAPGGLTFLLASGVGVTDSNGHGTSVTGIMTSRDATRKGIAPAISHFLVGLAGGNNTRLHGHWMIAQAPEKAEVINISFSLGSTTNDYHDVERWFDALINSSSTMVSKSTGNGGSGARTITQPGQAYNLMGVANMTFHGTLTRDDDRITSTSSRGTTFGGRRKPDITATGQGVFTANSGWAGGTHFTSFGGTSAAAPHVGACYLLVTDARGVDDPIAGKAVLLNTADAMSDNNTLSNSADDFYLQGSHWSPTYGWGYLDMAEALVNAPDVFVSTVSLNAESGHPRERFYSGFMFAGEKATLVWNRHLGYQSIGTPIDVRALTDLDLYAYSPDGTLITSSVTMPNNVEQIGVAQDGPVILRVAIAGNSLDPLVGVERFALATEELFEEREAPKLSHEIQPTTLIRGRINTIRATLSNVGDLNFGSAQSTISTTVLLRMIGPTLSAVGPIPGGESRVAEWRVRPLFTTATPTPVGVSATASGFGNHASPQQVADIPLACAGEFDGVGSVDIGDLLEFLGYWLAEVGGVGGEFETDIDASGQVDLLDLTTFIGFWQSNLGANCLP
ncbi:MAG: S8 family serine peptidase [Phycisphaeraceae bacterium]|nr:S8 family serine peptidase [Phycisphaeraceae bacterium]